MKAAEALIAWTPAGEPSKQHWPETAGTVKIGPLLNGGPDWTKPYRKTGGAAYTNRRDVAGWEQVAKVFMDFQGIVAAGVPYDVAHEAFLVIDEYRWMISPDLPGAEEMPEEFEALLRPEGQ